MASPAQAGDPVVIGSEEMRHDLIPVDEPSRLVVTLNVTAGMAEVLLLDDANAQRFQDGLDYEALHHSSTSSSLEFALDLEPATYHLFLLAGGDDVELTYGFVLSPLSGPLDLLPVVGVVAAAAVIAAVLLVMKRKRA